jgi:RNA polymerase sigma-70 factor (ECF subfamily)
VRVRNLQKSRTERLLHQARGGDGTALGDLLEQFRNYLKVLARLQLGRGLQSKLDASDLVQEVFLEAHRDFHQFHGLTEAELAGWLRRILASNLANVVRHYRGTKRRDVRLERQLVADIEQTSRVLAPALAADQSSPSQQAVRREGAVQLADALEQLPRDYRDVLILRHLEGLSFPEVAGRMERTVDSVKNLWARALLRMRQSLGEFP